MSPRLARRLAVATITALSMLAWQVFWIQPEHDCAKHRWGVWDAHDRACGKAVTLVPMR